MKSRSASIVINTLNRCDLLRRTLVALDHLQSDNFEVIVVNGPSTDQTEELLNEWVGRIKVGKCPVANLSQSRNIGITLSSGDIVAFIDDDAVPEPEWLSQIRDGFDSSEVAAVGGKVYDPTGHRFQYEFANADRLGNGHWRLKSASPHLCFPKSFEFPYLQGTNAAFRRDLLVAIGGFDEAYAYYLDETDVCMRLIDAGYLVHQLSNAFVHHKYAPSYIRTKTTAVARFPVLRSKIYFAKRNAVGFASSTEIEADNQRFIELHRGDVIASISAGLLPSNYLDAFEADVIKAKEAAESDLKQERQLLQPPLPPTDFQEFKSNKPIGSLLRIVLLCEDYPPNLLGGIARFTQDKATALARRGHIVHVVAKGEDHDTVDFEDGVWVHRIVPKHHDLDDAARAHNVPQSHWDQSRSFLTEIDSIQTRGNITVVEAPIWNFPAIAAVLSGRYKIVTSLQTTLKLSLPSRPDLTSDAKTMKQFVEPIVALERFMIENSSKILAISEAIANEVEAAYQISIPRHRLHVAHLGMPDWAGKEELLYGADTTNILFVGRLENRKGIDVLLACIPALCQSYSGATFHIVGDDTIPMEGGRTYRSKFQKSHPELIEKKRVIFHGKVADADLKHYYRSCDLFVAPSRFESFGLIFLEAMMFGKPVVGCAAGGMSEVVRDGETGILVAPGDRPSLFAAMDSLISDGELRERMGRAGRQRYEEHFTDDLMVERCITIYESSLLGDN